MHVTPTALDEIAATEAICRQALQSSRLDVASRLPGVPASAEEWFELMSGIPQDQKRVRRLAQLHLHAKQVADYPPGAIERFGILQTFITALPRIAALPVHPSIQLEFCATAKRIAARSEGWRSHFDHSSDAFQEIARIATLRRFHAGQLSFDIMAMPRTWLLKIHPAALPAVVRELFAGMGGIGPIAMPHLNYWRANPILMLQSESERALWRITKSIELQPEIKGLIASSWLYCASVGKITPRLAWVRDFFRDNGAFLVEMDPAPIRSGFMIGSELRRRLYAEGTFRPRETLVLWRREDMLRWAASYRPEPAEDEASPAPVKHRRPIPDGESPILRMTSSGRCTLLNGEQLLTDKPRRYILLVFVIPWLLLVVAAALGAGLGTALVTAILAPLIIWLFQYIFLQ